MGKAQRQKTAVGQQKQKNKGHKTIRQKLRKKRAQQKQHLKQKKQKRKLFNPEQQKKQFFQTHFNSLSQDKYKQAKKQFKYKKIVKYIQKFINIYQDDLQDFFELFKEFDQGGFLDISGLENKKLYKVLIKLFKYLPLNLTKKQQNGIQTQQYRKKKQSTLNLQNIIRNLVTQSIQNYMQNGTDNQKQKSQNQNEESSQNQQIQGIKKQKNNKKVNVNIRNQNQQGVFTLPKPKFQLSSINDPGFGPVISAQEREKIAELFQKQLQQMQNQKNDELQKQQDQFEKIFSAGTAVNKLKNPQKVQKKSALQDVPDHLLAQGSAKIGQKVTINDDEQQDYDKIHRPKKLIQEHRQIMAINRGDSQGNKNQRKAFNRQRDVVNSRNKFNLDNMQNGLFFNFKDKMSAPKKTNNFL